MLIFDDIRLRAFDSQYRETLMAVIDDRYDKRSTIIFSQK
ncbi:ATP-binding protein [Sphingobacterium sp. 1.A.5]|nr:ATP-binding protein [Sphingobacterium sp. 1.A.5]